MFKAKSKRVFQGFLYLSPTGMDTDIIVFIELKRLKTIVFLFVFFF